MELTNGVFAPKTIEELKSQIAVSEMDCTGLTNIVVPDSVTQIDRVILDGRSPKKSFVTKVMLDEWGDTQKCDQD